MGRRTVAAAMAVVMIGAVLAGCEGDSETGASPTVAVSSDTRPSATPTPTLTPSPTPSEDALFLEAKEVHLKYLEQFVALSKAGGTAALPSSMRALVSEEVGDHLTNGFSQLKEKGIYVSSDSTWRRTAVKQIPATKGHAVALVACVDFRNMTYHNKTEKTSDPGTWRRDQVQLDREGSNLIITDIVSKRAESCDLG